MTENDEAIIFSLYREKKIFESLASEKNDNFLDDIDTEHQNTILNNIIGSSHDFQCCINLLKEKLSVKGLTKLKTQYRQFKYRQKNELKSVLLKKSTLNLLNQLNDSNDGLDNFILGPLFDLEIRQKEIASYNSELDAPIEDRFYILSRELSFRELQAIYSLFDKVYREGFVDGQIHRKARTGSKMEQLINKSKVQNSVLNDLKEIN